MNILEVVENYRKLGYTVNSHSGDKTVYNLDAPRSTYILQLKAIDDNQTTVQAIIHVPSFMGEIKTWEFTYPNPNIERAISQLLNIKMSIEL